MVPAGLDIKNVRFILTIRESSVTVHLAHALIRSWLYRTSIRGWWFTSMNRGGKTTGHPPEPYSHFAFTLWRAEILRSIGTKSRRILITRPLVVSRFSSISIIRFSKTTTVGMMDAKVIETKSVYRYRALVLPPSFLRFLILDYPENTPFHTVV